MSATPTPDDPTHEVRANPPHSEDPGTPPMGDDMHSITENLKMTFHNYLRHNSGQQVRRGLQRAASQGFYVSPQAPFGYRKKATTEAGNKRFTLELNPEEAAIVRAMCTMAVQGLTYGMIAKELNAQGSPGPKNAPWNRNKVARVLQNEVSTGTLVLGIDRAEMVRVEDAFPAIITKEEFEELKRIRTQRNSTICKNVSDNS